MNETQTKIHAEASGKSFTENFHEAQVALDRIAEADVLVPELLVMAQMRLLVGRQQLERAMNDLRNQTPPQPSQECAR